MRSSPSTHTRADIIWRGMESEIEVETGIELLESQLAGNLRAIFQISQAGDDACSLMILITLALFMEPWKLVLQVCNYKTLTTRSLLISLMASQHDPKRGNLHISKGSKLLACTRNGTRSPIPQSRSQEVGQEVGWGAQAHQSPDEFQTVNYEGADGRKAPSTKGEHLAPNNPVKNFPGKRFNSICSLRSHNKLKCRQMQMQLTGFNELQT